MIWANKLRYWWMNELSDSDKDELTRKDRPYDKNTQSTKSLRAEKVRGVHEDTQIQRKERKV